MHTTCPFIIHLIYYLCPFSVAWNNDSIPPAATLQCKQLAKQLGTKPINDASMDGWTRCVLRVALSLATKYYSTVMLSYTIVYTRFF